MTFKFQKRFEKIKKFPLNKFNKKLTKYFLNLIQ